MRKEQTDENRGERLGWILIALALSALLPITTATKPRDRKAPRRATTFSSLRSRFFQASNSWFSFCVTRLTVLLLSRLAPNVSR